MARPLRELVAEKMAHYGASRTGFDDLSLLIVYNRAAIYNSPEETPLHNVDDAVEELQRVIRANRGPFNRVLLYIAVRPGERLAGVLINTAFSGSTAGHFEAQFSSAKAGAGRYGEEDCV